MKYYIHKEGRRPIFINTLFWVTVALFFIALSGNLWVKAAAVAVALVMIAIVMRFFRVPRRTPASGEGIVLAPCDGKVVAVKEVMEEEFFKCPCMKISIFMSVFNVHVNWYPASGNVTYMRYHEGNYLVAFHPKSSEKNEHTTIGLRTPQGRDLMFRQIAGYIARRIVCYANEGDSVEAGAQAGFIRFGSRVDVFLPLGTTIFVEKGDKVKGQLTTLAKFSS